MQDIYDQVIQHIATAHLYFQQNYNAMQSVDNVETHYHMHKLCKQPTMQSMCPVSLSKLTGGGTRIQYMKRHAPGRGKLAASPPQSLVSLVLGWL